MQSEPRSSLSLFEIFYIAVEAGAEEFKAYVPDMDVKKADVMASVKTKLYR